MYKYKEGNNRPSSVNQISLVHKIVSNILYNFKLYMLFKTDETESTMHEPNITHL